ncbi:MAG: thioesterase family protein [Planctomycetia bacterium]|nr:thioesterase family protein [Planctomycetia bacterium]
MDLSALPITYRAVIPDAYLDEMGHMNVMWYTHLFSMGAWGLFQMVGITLEYFKANNAGSFALEQHFTYLKEVRVGQHITIRSRVLGRTAKRLHSMHFMTIDELDVLAATVESVNTHVDLKVRRSSSMPPHITEAIDRLLTEHTRLSWAAPVCGSMKV